MDDDEIADLFAVLGPVSTRRMFSGRGIYRDGLIFALALRGEVFLKADAGTEELFRAAGSSPFTYTRKGRGIVALSYWRLPDVAIDDPDEIARWSRLAIEAALRARSTRQPKRKAAGKVRKKARRRPRSELRRRVRRPAADRR